MKFIVVDYLFPKGHKKFNTNFVKMLANIGNVILIAKKDFYNPKEFNNLNYEVSINEFDFELRRHRILSRVDSIKIMKLTQKYVKEYNPDAIFVTAFDTLSFYFAKYIFYNSSLSKFYIVHHNNTDELKNKTKYSVFSKYMNRVNHIVLSDFIKEYLVQATTINKDNVWVIPHPMNIEKITLTEKKYLCVGISNSNNEELISEIVDYEKNNNFFSKNKVKGVFKSKDLKFDNNYLKIIHGYIDDEEYKDYTLNCKFMYIPFPDTFQYRLSGTLIDALSNDTIIIGRDIPLIRYYSERYPEICKVANSTDDLFVILSKKPGNTVLMESQFRKFKTEHSDHMIISRLKKITLGDSICR